MKLRTARAAMPGAPDKPRAKRTTAEVQAEKAAKEKTKKEKETAKKQAISRVAELEDEMQHKDALTEVEANHPPKKTLTKKSRPVVEDKGQN